MRALRLVFARAADHGDPILVALLALTAMVETLVSGAPLSDALLVCVIVLPLLVRRRAPLAVLVFVVVATYAGYARGDSVGGSLEAGSPSTSHCIPSRRTAAQASDRRRRDRRRVRADVRRSRAGRGRARDGCPAEWLLLAGIWTLGRGVRQRRRRTEDLERHAADLEADREALAREAVADERARIAREMHDAVAHSVSVMVLQAGAAEQVLASSPERARESLVTIQDTGREAIVELRRMLGLLRDPVAGAALAPQPGVANSRGCSSRSAPPGCRSS